IRYRNVTGVQTCALPICLMQKTEKMGTLAIDPAERVDVIIDFSKFEGETIHLKNDLGENADPEDETHDVMQFRVTLPLSSEDKKIGRASCRDRVYMSVVL